MVSIDKYHPVKSCVYCGKSMTVQNIKKHESLCKKNPLVIEKDFRRKKNLKEKIFICENCKIAYSVLNDRDSIRFCSDYCSYSFSSKQLDNSATKTAMCLSCEHIFEIKLRRSLKNFICDDCKRRQKEKDRKTKQEEITCQYCNRTIKRIQGLVLHERSCSLNPNAKKRTLNYHRKDKRNGYIYKTTNLINNKIYIGKKIGDPNKSENYFGSGILLKKAVRKYGKDCFTKEILEIIVDGDMNERERFWIKKFKSNSIIGYNLTEGGDGGSLFKGKHHSKETKEKLRNFKLKSKKKLRSSYITEY